jgi:O-antigen ligase
MSLNQAGQGQEGKRWAWLTTLAVVLLLGFVLARAMMFEVDRDAGATVRGAGPITSLGMDLLCCVPALLVGLRRVVDRGYRLQLNWSQAIMGVLAVWMAASVLWAGDKFIAAASASHFIAGLVVLWSATQLIRSWLRVRLVVGLLVGLLLGQVCYGLMYRYSDVPNTAHFFDEHKAQILREHGWREGDFAATQFEKKLKSGEIMGFTASPNSYAAVLVLLSVVGMGWILQHWSEREAGETDWAIGLVGIVVALGLGTIVFTNSRTAMVTPVLAVLGFGALWLCRRWLHAHAGKAYWAGVGLVALAAAALIGHGLAHGNLIQDSLTFRWHYWVGSMRLFLHHPLRGVGWGNFGEHYLAYRLPVASEEIKDPHNLFVRFFTELGAVGGVLALAWLLRLWWELTRPTRPPAPPAELTNPGEPAGAGRAGRDTVLSAAASQRSPLGFLAVVIAGAYLITILASIDWANDSGYITMEVLRRILYFAALYIAATAATVRSLERPRWDPRAAPWMLYGLLIAAGLFLLHNQIDFSLFETGPLMVFALAAGSALGARGGGRPRPAAAEERPQRWPAAAGLAVAAVLWVGVGVFLFIPTAEAEQLLARADRAAQAGRHTEAAQLLVSAFDRQPMNGDYVFRASEEAARAHAAPAEVEDLLNQAIAADPFNMSYWLRRAQVESARPQPDRAAVERDYNQALALNPHDVSTHRSFAEVLEHWGQREAARAQYQAALAANAGMEAADARRLPERSVQEIEAKIASLGSGG